MCSCRIGISLVTGIGFSEFLLSPMSGVSLEGDLECPVELGVIDPDCLESRPPTTVFSCLLTLKEGIVEYCAMSGTGLRCRELMERFARFERLEAECSAESTCGGGMGGRALVDAADIVSAIALDLCYSPFLYSLALLYIRPDPLTRWSSGAQKWPKESLERSKSAHKLARSARNRQSLLERLSVPEMRCDDV